MRLPICVTRILVCFTCLVFPKHTTLAQVPCLTSMQPQTDASLMSLVSDTFACACLIVPAQRTLNIVSVAYTVTIYSFVR